MKKTQYRIVQTRRGYYPQVRFKNFLIWWGRWYRIAEHEGGTYGVYTDKSYPHGSSQTAEQVLKGYHAWIEDNEPITGVMPIEV